MKSSLLDRGVTAAAVVALEGAKIPAGGGPPEENAAEGTADDAEREGGSDSKSS